MPIYHETDLPLLEGEQEDLPIESPPELKRSPLQIKEMKRGHAAVVKADVDNMDVFEAFKALPEDADPEIMLDVLSYKRSEDQQARIRDYFNEHMGNTPVEVAENVEIMDEMITQAEANRDSPNRQVAEAFSGLDVEEEELQRIEADMNLVGAINDMVSDYGFFEKAIDFAKMFAPGDVFKDNIDIAGNPFGAEAFIKDIVVGFKEMRRSDPEKFNKIFPTFLEAIKEDLPTGKQLAILNAIASPRGEEELHGFGSLDLVLDSFDVAGLGTYAAVKTGQLVNRLNAIRIAKNLRNSEMAADINTAVLVDETGEAATAAGVDLNTAYGNAAPFNTSRLDWAYTGKVSSEILSRMQKVKAEQRRVANIIRSEEGILRESLLTPAERKAAEETFEKEMKVQGYENVQIKKQHRDYTEFSFDMVDPETGKTIVQSQRMDLKLSDKTEIWEKTEQGVMANWLKSPTVWAKSAIEDVKSAIRLDSTSPVVGSMLKQLQKEALAPLFGKRGFGAFSPRVRKQMAEIDEVLLAGDSFKDANGIRGKVYSVDELKGGVNGVRLNDKQIEVYYNIRNLSDEFWVIHNDETRRILTSQGKKEVVLPNGPQIGTPQTKEGAVGFMNQEGTLRVYNAATDEIIDLRGADVGALYDQGLVLSKLDDPIKLSDDADELFDVVITASDKTRDLPFKVLHFKEGYVPKINKNSYWFVKRTGSRTVNGKVKTNQVLETERFFSSRTEAEAWMKAQGRDDLIALPDRALERQIVGSSQMGAGGGLYTGPRAQKDIPFGPEGLPAERLNTYEALSQNIQSLENYVTRNQWRLAMQKKWVNSVQAAGLDETGEIARAGFKPELLPDGDPRAENLRKLGEQIRIWSGFPTRGELAWDGAVSNAMEWALNKPFLPKKQTVQFANFLRNAGDPITKMRSIAFHTLLGWFNPGQLWVQAQGASIALSLLGPVRGANVFRKQTALAFAANVAEDSAALKHLAKGFAMSEDELAQIVKLWKKTGYADSITNTADHTAALKGYGITQDALRRVSEKGLYFYRKGELFNRRFSFLAALDRHQKKFGNINLTDDQLKAVISDANNMMLNLSKANRAVWQRGPIALPTQFLQVQAKFIEEVVFGIGKSFTPGERFKIMAGQLALYGSAGIPLFGDLATRAIVEATDFDQADIEDPENAGLVKFVNGGFWDWWVFTMMGADVDMASRGAIANGITESTIDLMFSEASIAEKISGAFGIVPHRFFQSYRDIKPMVAGALFHGAELTDEEILQAFSSMASITSTWNNVQKAAVMHNLNMLIDSRGNPVVAGKDFDIMTEVMVMLGFQPSDLKRVRDLESLVRSRKEYRTHITNTLMDSYWDYVKTFKGADTEAEKDKIVKNFEIRNRLIVKTLRNEEEVKKVMESLKTRLDRGEDRKSRAVRQFIEEFNDGQVLAYGSIVASMKADGMIQLGVGPIDTEEQE